MIDDAPWIDRTLRGDSVAYGELWRNINSGCSKPLCPWWVAREDAEDLVQEAFVQAYLKLKTFQQNSAFFTWLYRIAFNLAMTWRRKQKKHLSLDAAREDNGLEASDATPAVDENLLQQERAVLVNAALQEMLADIGRF